MLLRDDQPIDLYGESKLLDQYLFAITPERTYFEGICGDRSQS